MTRVFAALSHQVSWPLPSVYMTRRTIQTASSGTSSWESRCHPYAQLPELDLRGRLQAGVPRDVGDVRSLPGRTAGSR